MTKRVDRQTDGRRYFIIRSVFDDRKKVSAVIHCIVQITIINNRNLNCEDVADVRQNFNNANNLYDLFTILSFCTFSFGHCSSSICGF
jgi:hypothetical protein